MKTRKLSLHEMETVEGGHDGNCWAGLGLAIAGFIGSAWTGVGAIMGAIAVGSVVAASIACES